MKNEFFELNCTINNNHKNKFTLKIPMAIHNEFERAISGADEAAMANLTELFAEIAELNDIKRMTFQALVEKRADTVHSFSNMLELLKAVRLCTAFFGTD